MKQQKGKKIDNERLNNLKAKESSADLSWVLKTSNLIELQSTIQMMPFIEVHAEIEKYDLQGVCHIVSNNTIQLKFISIADGLLTYQDDTCVVLSDCTAYKKKFHCHHNQLFLIIIQSNVGKLVLIFTHPESQKYWFSTLKRSAKQIDFLKKYRISDVLFQNFYQICHKKKKHKLCAQIINKKKIKCQEQLEIINNYIKIVRNGNVQNYLPIISVYDDFDILYLVTENFIGSTLEKLFQSNKVQITQTDLAFIIYSVLQNIRSLQEEDIFHGNINPENIIMANQQGQLQIFIVNSNYRPYKQNEIDFYIETIPNHFIAPEVSQKKVGPSINTDIFQLGITLFLVSFFPQGQIFNYNYAKKMVTNIQEFVKQQEVHFEKCQDSDFPYLFSACQLDLIKKMIEQDPNKRITIQDALKHAWFINTKDKIKAQKQSFNRHLPSLKTIIEMVEQSEYDIRRRSIQNTNGQNQSSQFKQKYEQASSILKFDFSVYQQDVSPLRKSSESQIEIIDEGHEISRLIGNLNNKKYCMLPSQDSHYLINASPEKRLVSTENNLQQFQN